MAHPLNIRFFASLRERLALESLSLEWPGGTVAELRLALVARGPQWADFSQPSRIRVAVNQAMAAESAEVRPGDEVAFFPPVTGG